MIHALHCCPQHHGEVQWIKCYLDVPNCYQRHTCACLYPLCARRMRNLELLQGTFLNIPEQSSATMIAMEEEGIMNVIQPPCSSSLGTTKVPFFLRDTLVAGIYVCPPPPPPPLLQDAAHAAACKKRKKTAMATVAASGGRDDEMFHARKQPSFENICGCVFLPYMTLPPSMLPPSPEPKIFTEGKASARKRSSGSSSAGRNKRLENNPSSASSSLDGIGKDVFTVHGNLVLKKMGYGTLVNFKVRKDHSSSCFLLLLGLC